MCVVCVVMFVFVCVYACMYVYVYVYVSVFVSMMSVQALLVSPIELGGVCACFCVF